MLASPYSASAGTRPGSAFSGNLTKASNSPAKHDPMPDIALLTIVAAENSRPSERRPVSS